MISPPSHTGPPTRLALPAGSRVVRHRRRFRRRYRRGPPARLQPPPRPEELEPKAREQRGDRRHRAAQAAPHRAHRPAAAVNPVS